MNIDKSKEYDFAIPWLGVGLFTSTGDKWRIHRKMLTPAFHFRILESFVPIIQKQQKIMLNLIKKQMDANNVIDDIRPLVTNCAMDIICGKAMERLPCKFVDNRLLSRRNGHGREHQRPDGS